MFKQISCENLSKPVQHKLHVNYGYNYVSDLQNSNSAWVRDVASEIENNNEKFTLKSALEMCQDEVLNYKIKTHCRSLDACLNGGVSCGKVLEVCGAPAQGKTQLCLQLCVCAQLPTQIGGLESEALYIDTAANFTAHRLKDIAEYYKERFSNECISWNSEMLLKKVHYLKVLGTARFVAAMHILEKFVKDNTQIKLIVIDNIATPFKDGCSDTDRIGILYSTMALLNRLAHENKLAVVITNEVNMRLGLEESQVGALGDTWAHLTHRLLLAPPLIAMRHQCAPSPVQIGRQGISDCAK